MRRSFGKEKQDDEAITIDNPRRCAWVTNGKRCWLYGAMSLYIGDGRRSYCHWHYVALTSPREADNYREFVRWNGHWSGYCSVENHHAIDEIWDAIQGIRPLKSEPGRCNSPFCIHTIRADNNERSIPDERPALLAGGCSGHPPATLPEEAPF